MFRNHSLFFIGPGLSEDYFIGLFGEVLERYGGNPHTHVALFNKKDIDDGSIDPQFLHTKLNVVAFYYEDKAKRYDGLAPCLDKLVEAINGQSQNCGSFHLLRKHFQNSAKIVLANLNFVSAQCRPLKTANVIFAAQASPIRYYYQSTIGKGIISKYYEEYHERKFEPTNRNLLWKYGDYPLYAAIARNIQDHVTSYDSKDLRKLSEAMFDALAETNGKFEVINIMLIAAGKNRFFHLYTL